MAFVYLTDSGARYRVAGGNQEMDGMALVQTFTQGPVLGVSGSRMGCAFNCCFSGCQEEKINEMAEHSKPSFRLRLLGGFGSQIGCLPCFCGSQKGVQSAL